MIATAISISTSVPITRKTLLGRLAEPAPYHDANNGGQTPPAQ